jgi:PPM family protein phosphatase
MTWELGASMLSDVGCHRPINEDSGCIVRPADAAVLADRGVLAIVADGMGGHSAGEVASRMAVDVIRRRYYEEAGGPYDALRSALQAANAAIFQRAGEDPELNGMGTTCVALALCSDQACVASVGDSRLYLARGGRIYQMTMDDSAVGDMVTRGVISRDEARHHQDRNVILRALGTHESVDIFSWQQPFPMREGDIFVLCSDGLTDLVADQEILETAESLHEADACRALVDKARKRGGFDNITVAILRLALAPSPSTETPPTRSVPMPT